MENKIIIGNLNINSLPNKSEQLKDIVWRLNSPWLNKDNIKTIFTDNRYLRHVYIILIMKDIVVQYIGIFVLTETKLDDT